MNFKFVSSKIDTRSKIPTLSELVKQANTKKALAVVKTASAKKTVEKPVMKKAEKEEKEEIIEVEKKEEKPECEVEKKEEKVEEKEASSDVVVKTAKFFRVAELTPKQKEFVRKVWSLYWPKSFIDSLLA